MINTPILVLSDFAAQGEKINGLDRHREREAAFMHCLSASPRLHRNGETYSSNMDPRRAQQRQFHRLNFDRRQAHIQLIGQHVPCHVAACHLKQKDYFSSAKLAPLYLAKGLTLGASLFAQR